MEFGEEIIIKGITHKFISVQGGKRIYYDTMNNRIVIGYTEEEIRENNKYKKTIVKFLNDLPEPYKSQALKNGNRDIMYSFGVGSYREAISTAFTFVDSPEGYKYWNKFASRLDSIWYIAYIKIMKRLRKLL